MSESGRLFVVSTPIGNLGDLSVRAADVLRSVSLILAEDTRHSRHLLKQYGITTSLASYHEHNEAKATPRLVVRLLAGEQVALISDAGTPLLSDPGARLVRAAIEAGIPVVAVPGASALLAALVVSGIDAERFTFVGFLPRKGRERKELIGEIAALSHTVVLYESPVRVGATLAELAESGCAGRATAVARELTKQYEDVRRGTVEELAAYYSDTPPRGEVVIVMGGASRSGEPMSEEAMRDRVRALRDEGLSAREVAARLARDHGVARNVAYKIAHES